VATISRDTTGLQAPNFSVGGDGGSSSQKVAGLVRGVRPYLYKVGKKRGDEIKKMVTNLRQVMIESLRCTHFF
jgi:hypothetical protein